MRYIAVIICLIFVFTLSACERYPGGQLTGFWSDMAEVKDMIFIHTDLHEPIGKAFNSWFESPTWNSSRSYYKAGETEITFEGSIKGTAQKVRMDFMCSFDKERGFRVCEYSGLRVNDQYKNKDFFKSLLDKIAHDLKESGNK